MLPARNDNETRPRDLYFSFANRKWYSNSNRRSRLKVAFISQSKERFAQASLTTEVTTSVIVLSLYQSPEVIDGGTFLLGQAGTSRSMVRLSPVIALRLKYYWLQRQKRVKTRICADLFRAVTIRCSLSPSLYLR